MRAKASITTERRTQNVMVFFVNNRFDEGTFFYKSLIHHSTFVNSLTHVVLSQLSGGDHILITREDRRSQLQTFKSALAYLNDGVPVMAFPEGQRSKTGRLEEFKPGAFR